MRPKSQQIPEATTRKMLQPSQFNVDQQIQHPAMNWAKIIGLLLFTFGLIVLVWVICNAFQHMKGQGSGSIYSSFNSAGGLILGLFLFYIISFGVAWYCGYGKRDIMRREAVERQIALQKSMRAEQNID